MGGLPRFEAEVPSMTLHPYLPGSSAFDPEAILTMSIAFELTCVDLQVSADNESSREMIAARIIRLARQGITCPAVLHQRAIADQPKRLCS